LKKIIILVLKLLLFWLVLFALQHTVFLIYNSSELKNIGFGQIMLSYFYGLRMDLSASAYLMVLPLVLLIISLFITRNGGIIKSIHVINIFLILACLLIAICDTGLYSIWGTKINRKAMSYVVYPKEAFMAAAAVPYWLFTGIFIAEGILSIFVYKRVFRPGFFGKIKTIHISIFTFVLLLLLVSSMRGGFQKYAMSKRNVYFSTHAVLNNSALNGFWNFMEIIVNPESKKNPYAYYSTDTAQDIVRKMNAAKSDSTEMILTTSRPNIVLILMESVSAENLLSLGGTEEIMPALDSLSKKGLLFNNFYANGFRTEQGIISVLSSFPAQPQTSIMRNINKFEHLPNLGRILGDSGYSENYYYSGNLEFANMDAFAKVSGFTHILDKDNYNWKRSTDWGAYDEELFACHLKEAEKDKQPFFDLIMTATNHEPFDADVKKVFKENKASDNYKNTAHYTDHCLSEYFNKVKLKSWYNNTLFVLVSDHAHSFPMERGANEAERHHIPLVFYGNVIKPEYRGTVISKYGSQIDLPAMILSQLGIPYKQFQRSKNLFNKFSPEFGYYTFDNGFGIVTAEQTLVYDQDMGQVVFRKNKQSAADDDKLLSQGKAYLQILFEDYLHLND